jgi:hypothetical protein
MLSGSNPFCFDGEVAGLPGGEWGCAQATPAVARSLCTVRTSPLACQEQGSRISQAASAVGRRARAITAVGELAKEPALGLTAQEEAGIAAFSDTMRLKFRKAPATGGRELGRGLSPKHGFNFRSVCQQLLKRSLPSEIAFEPQFRELNRRALQAAESYDQACGRARECRPSRFLRLSRLRSTGSRQWRA